MPNPDTLRKQWLSEDETKINSAVEALLKADNGRKFLWWVLGIGRVGQQPYANNALNTAFTCGELNVGQQVLDRIVSVSPDGYVDMLKEQQDERRRRDDALVGRADGPEPGLDEDE